MKKKSIIVLCALVLCVVVPLCALGFGSLLNSITIHGNIVSGPSSLSSPISLNLGTMNESTSGEITPVNANSTLTLTQESNVTFAYDNVSELSPFTGFQTLIYINGTASSWIATIGNITSTIQYSDTVLNVPEGTYPLWIACNYVTGPTPATVTITISVTYSP